MENKFESCSMLIHDEWRNLKPFLNENGIKIISVDSSKYVYAKFEVTKKEYDKIDEFIQSIKNPHK